MSAEANTQLATLQPPEQMNPIMLLQIAVQRGIDAEQLKLLMELQREWKADNARDAFITAMNGFRAKALKIVKTKAVSFGNTSYKHATLANIVEVAAPALSEHGLSHRWETKQEGGNGLITVTCIITHQAGHSEQTSLSAAPDSSGGKNAIQGVGSAVSYLQRYTFMAITGLAAQDQDDDARPVERVSEEQAANLEALLTEVGANREKFLGYFRIAAIGDLAAKEYGNAVKQLEKKRRG